MTGLQHNTDKSDFSPSVGVTALISVTTLPDFINYGKVRATSMLK
jgi:hypothetical protein